MTSKENIATVRRFWEGFNAHNLDVWDEVCAPDFISHDPGLPTPEADLATIKQTIGAMQAAFPDMGSSEEDLIAEGNKVVVRRIIRGTHQGEFMGVGPTGNRVSIAGVWIPTSAAGRSRNSGSTLMPWACYNKSGRCLRRGKTATSPGIREFQDLNFAKSIAYYISKNSTQYV